MVKSVLTEIYAATLHAAAWTAQMDGATMVYTPGASFTGIDTVIYKVTMRKILHQPGYGFVYINRDSVPPVIPPWPVSSRRCKTPIDIRHSAHRLIYIDVLKNDQLCDSLKTFTITRQPGMVQRSYNNTKRIGYNRVVLKSDSLQYEICTEEYCSRATAYIKQD